MIDPDDDRFHSRTPDLYWNESSGVIFYLPEQEIKGVVYFYHRPNMSLSAGGPFIWGKGGGEETYDCLYWGFNPYMRLPDGADMNEFRLDNSLAVSTVELQKTLRMSYESRVLSLDLTYDAIMPPQEMLPVDGRINPTIAESFLAESEHGTSGIGHYEQAGRVTGAFTLRGKTYQVDCLSYRDHTWGPRPFRTWPRGAYHSAVASADSSFLVGAVTRALGAADPVVGTREPVFSGWYMKDGIVGRLVGGERICVERGADGRPAREVVQAEDHLGRSLYAEGTLVNALKWTGYRDCLTWWCLARWDFDGRSVWGEISEFLPFEVYSRFLSECQQVAPGT